MEIVDSQIHIWPPESRERPWVKGAQSYAHGGAMPVDQVVSEMDEAGVDRAVLVPPSWEGERNDACIAAAREFPQRFAVMGRLRLASRLSSTELKALVGIQGLVGVRCTFRRPKAVAQLSNGVANWLWGAAEELGLPVAVYAPGSSSKLRQIAQTHPGLKLIVDHVGLPLDIKDEEMLAVVEQTCQLAVYPNVAVKVSCLPNNVSEGFPFLLAQEAVYKVIDAFGAARVFWGSDLSRLRCPYREVVALFRDELIQLTQSERELLLGRAIEDYLNWPSTTSPTLGQSGNERN